MTKQLAKLHCHGVFTIVHDDTDDCYRIYRKSSNGKHLVKRYNNLSDCMCYLYKLTLYKDSCIAILPDDIEWYRRFD